MITTYQAGVLGAQIRLTLLQSITGLVITHSLTWVLKNEKQEFNSTEALAVLLLPPGEYEIQAHYKQTVLEFGKVNLVVNTRTDVVFVLPEREVASSDQYFLDYDPLFDHARRVQERELQAKEHGFAEMPLRDPRQVINGEMSMRLQAHPLLSQAAQFDGLPPDFRPEPHENKEALQLTLTQRLAAMPSASITPTPTR